jgi:signal transduction histidine kinase
MRNRHGGTHCQRLPYAATLRGVKRIAGAIAAIAAALLVGGLVLAYEDRHVLPVSLQTWSPAGLAVTTLGLATSGGGLVLAAKRPANPIGWLALAAGLSLAITDFGHNYGVRALVAAPGSLPGGHLAMWLYYLADMVTWCCLALALLLFPDGGLPSTRWRPAAWCAGGICAATVVSGAGGATRVWAHPFQPILQVVIPLVFGVRLLLFPIALAISVAAVVTRFVRSAGAERRQLTWFAAAAALVGITAIPVILTNSPTSVVILMLALIFLEATLGLAVMKYRLYDIDIVISRTVQYGALAAFIAAVYSGLVIGVGTLAGDAGSPLLAAVAAAVVAVAFEPVRRRARRLANRLVYGHRATPYQVLSDFARRIGGGYTSEDALPQMARIVAAGTGAERVVVWLRVGDELRPGASSDGRADDAPLAIGGHQGPLPAADFSVPVSFQGELLGAIAITMPKSEPLRPAGQQLVADVASQAGLVLHNVGLVEDLRASRQRLVFAQDEERRRLERNLHDGAQQDLVILLIKARLAAQTIADVAQGKEALEELRSDATTALENLRDLARGVYPPLLADRGLAEALNAHARKSPLPVTVHAAGLDRFSQDAEAAVYFCCLEALQNVTKYAGASRATVAVCARDSALRFTVSDDGAGFDAARTPLGAGLRNMSDRLAALGGRLDVSSIPGGGTTIAGHLPIAG